MSQVILNLQSYTQGIAFQLDNCQQTILLKYRKNAINLDSRQDVRVTDVQDSHGSDSEQLTADGTQLVVTTLEVVDLSLGQHSVVLQLRLSQDWGVTGDDDQLSLTRSQGLDGRLVAQGVLTGLDNQTQLGVDVLVVLALWGHLCDLYVV